jgi:hypothetical protein
VLAHLCDGFMVKGRLDKSTLSAPDLPVAGQQSIARDK